MKKVLFFLVVLMFTTMSYAQSKLVATLTHGDNVTMYYGSDAFKNAYDAAKSGDVIMLSGGKFKGTKITKAVTIRGEGSNASIPTEIDSDFIVEIPQSDSQTLSVEGVSFTQYVRLLQSPTKPYFLKCKFYVVYFEKYDSMAGITLRSTIKDLLFVNCNISNFYLKGSTNVKLYNSFIMEYSNYDYDNSSDISQATFVNCVYSGSVGQCYRSSFINCIFTNYGTLPSETAVMNCAAHGNSIFYNMQGSEISCYYYENDNIFKNDQFYELIDDAKSTYLGTDGTEIGLYGGPCPYSSIPNYPRITKFDVAKQTTADNKLSVDIEVSAAK